MSDDTADDAAGETAVTEQELEEGFRSSPSQLLPPPPPPSTATATAAAGMAEEQTEGRELEQDGFEAEGTTEAVRLSCSFFAPPPGPEAPQVTDSGTEDEDGILRVRLDRRNRRKFKQAPVKNADGSASEQEQDTAPGQSRSGGNHSPTDGDGTGNPESHRQKPVAPLRNSSNESNDPAGSLYFFGIIDILTQYNAFKRAGATLKSITHSYNDISAVDPVTYRDRFIRFLDEHTA